MKELEKIITEFKHKQFNSEAAFEYGLRQTILKIISAGYIKKSDILKAFRENLPKKKEKKYNPVLSERTYLRYCGYNQCLEEIIDKLNGKNI